VTGSAVSAQNISQNNVEWDWIERFARQLNDLLYKLIFYRSKFAKMIVLSSSQKLK